MKLISPTIFQDGQIHGTIVLCSYEEYNQCTMHDIINENQVSATFLKEYIQKNNIDLDELIKKMEIHTLTPTGPIWKYAKTITITNVKEILHEANLDFFAFIDIYCEYLKLL